MNKVQGNKTVFYIGPFSFPNGGAAARRILGNYLSLKDNGFDVKILSGQKKDFQIEFNNNSEF